MFDAGADTLPRVGDGKSVRSFSTAAESSSDCCRNLSAPSASPLSRSSTAALTSSLRRLSSRSTHDMAPVETRGAFAGECAACRCVAVADAAAVCPCAAIAEEAAACCCIALCRFWAALRLTSSFAWFSFFISPKISPSTESTSPCVTRSAPSPSRLRADRSTSGVSVEGCRAERRDMSVSVRVRDCGAPTRPHSQSVTPVEATSSSFHTCAFS